MSIELIYFISKISCNNGFTIEGDTFSFVIDREISAIVNNHNTKPPGIQLRENEAANKQAMTIIWDKNFPRPYFYLVECKNSNLEKFSVLHCLSSSEEVLCGFVVGNNNGLMISDFSDLNENNLNVKNKMKKPMTLYLVIKNRTSNQSITVWII